MQLMININYSDLAGKIIGAAMEVYKALGNGFQEVIYQRALAIEFENQKISFAREQEMEIKDKISEPEELISLLKTK